MVSFRTKLKAHLWTLPRWFAAPWFGGVLLLGAAIAGGIDINAWIGLAAGLCVMAGGHSFNSVLDYSWTGLDKGEVEDRSAEKSYTGGQNLIEAGIVTPREIAFNASCWYIASTGPIVYLMINVGPWIFAAWFLSLWVTFWYSAAKFNWTHELALFVGAGPMAVMIGMYSVSPSPPFWAGLAASIPSGLILSFVGLPLDEWPDAEANLKKGVKSIAYKVWENQVNLGMYLVSWVIFVYIIQSLLIQIGLLSSWTGITLVLVPFFMAAVPFLKKYFHRTATVLVIIGACYPLLTLIGQIIGG